MNGILDTLGTLESDILMTDKEQEAFDIAIQAITDIINAINGFHFCLDDEYE